jgi:hypothetical protein
VKTWNKASAILLLGILVGVTGYATPPKAHSSEQIVREEFTTNIDFHVGPVGSLTGNVHLFLHRATDQPDVLELQLSFDLGRATPHDLWKQVDSIPSDEVSAWMLTSEGRALHLRRRDPPFGQHPGGIINAGSGEGFVTFWFDRDYQNAPLAVVMRFRSEFRVFSLSSPSNVTK